MGTFYAEEGGGRPLPLPLPLQRKPAFQGLPLRLPLPLQRKPAFQGLQRLRRAAALIFGAVFGAVFQQGNLFDRLCHAMPPGS